MRMRLWLSKSSQVPLREQLTTQILLGIFSNDLKPGEKLPSTRELALRFDIHPNTVSAAYRDLARRRWVEFRKGSGVYVKHAAHDRQLEEKVKLDHLISTLFQAAREHGYSLRQVQTQLKRWLELQPPDHFLVIEPEVELRAILVAEIEKAISFPVLSTSPGRCRQDLAGAVPVFMSNREHEIRTALPPGTSCLLLHARSVPSSLIQQAPIPPEALIAVASRWPEFLRWTRTVLEAAGVCPDALHFRDARKRNWQHGLQGATVVVCDVVTAEAVPAGCRQYVFPLLSENSLGELRRFVEYLKP